jgi:UDP-N-acetylenolpyruvoylglucosamine reductase
LALMDLAKETVKAKTGIDLEPEIRIIGGKEQGE